MKTLIAKSDSIYGKKLFSYPANLIRVPAFTSELSCRVGHGKPRLWAGCLVNTYLCFCHFVCMEQMINWAHRNITLLPLSLPFYSNYTAIVLYSVLVLGVCSQAKVNVKLFFFFPFWWNSCALKEKHFLVVPICFYCYPGQSAVISPIILTSSSSSSSPPPSLKYFHIATSDSVRERPIVKGGNWETLGRK